MNPNYRLDEFIPCYSALNILPKCICFNVCYTIVRESCGLDCTRGHNIVF